MLTVSRTTPVRARAAVADDEGVLLAWANDPVARRNAFASSPISEATHQAWFRERLRHPDGCRIYIIETGEGVALGQVRFDLRNQMWEIDYAVAPLFRGRGLGQPVLNAALSRLRADVAQPRVRGVVKPDNQPSQRVFSALGFSAGTPHPDGALVFERAL